MLTIGRTVTPGLSSLSRRKLMPACWPRHSDRCGPA
jgi:hypothetical protein